MLEGGSGQLADLTATLEMLGSDRGDIARECLDHGKTMVTSACAAASLLLQPFEERTDDIDVEDRVIESVSSAPLS